MLKKYDYTLIGKYINANTKVDVLCPKKHKIQIKIGDFNFGVRCGICAPNRKKTLDEIKQSLKNENYRYIGEEKGKLIIKCENGHKSVVSKYSWFSGHRCKICSRRKISEFQKHSYEFVKSKFENVGYFLLETNYKNALSPVSLRCQNNHIFQMSYANFQQGNRCPYCKGTRFTQEDIIKILEKEGYVLLSGLYKNNLSRLELKCPKNHVYSVTYNNFQAGCRCPICFQEKLHSNAEKEIANYIKSIYNGTIIENDRSQIFNPKTGKMLELDIWLPVLNKAIEYNGEYWHSKKYVKYKDNQKLVQCKNKGIDLLIIEEEKWNNNKDFKRIDNFLRGK